MSRQRMIFHIDINHCYAQIEEMMYPALRDVPMAVGGHEEKRHGIILTKNDKAKKYGVKTGESLREAKEKCPDLLIIPPHYDDYIYYTNQVKNIYRDYTDRIESFGMDEAWIDYTDSAKLFGDPVDIAKKIQQRVFDEIGLTVSVGVSWNKVFAKFGSDYRKPSGFTVITKENYKDIVWPSPVEDLLYVGWATTHKLHQRGILTIGELANYSVDHLKRYMGSAGELIHAFANGEDYSEVAEQFYTPPAKSVGNSITMVHDVASLEELRPVCFVLSEAVASRVRGLQMEGDVIGVSMRTSGMDWFGAQIKIGQRTSVSEDIMDAAMILLARYDFSLPLRAVGISISGLKPASSFRRLNLFVNEEDHDKARLADLAMDEIRDKYGFYSVRRACTLLDRPLTEFNVKDDHTVHPVGYFQGRSFAEAFGKKK